jgi:hypothetical protein
MIDIDSVDNSATGFATAADTDKAEFNVTTTGMARIGDWFKCVDAQDAVWHVTGIVVGSGSIATPFANTA